MITIRTAAHLHKNILSWYKINGRIFPWRSTHNPYRILLSEVMAQQTQISRVEIFYKAWIKQYPTIQSLSHATVGDVLRLWSGLGYNNRAIRLHELSKIIVQKNKTQFPTTSVELLELPGIGKYTAHALLCFAFKKHVPVVDVNIKRIFGRVFGKVSSSNELMTEQQSWEIAETILPRGKAFEWNQALMDLGGLVCTARAPRCTECPISKQCSSSFSPFLLVVEKKINNEPKWKNIPRRLYRGKILKLLHHNFLQPEEIAEGIWGKYLPRDVEWIETVLAQMKNDGLIVQQKKRFGLFE